MIEERVSSLKETGKTGAALVCCHATVVTAEKYAVLAAQEGAGGGENQEEDTFYSLDEKSSLRPL